MMNIKRNILWFIFAFSAFMLWNNYINYTTPTTGDATQQVVGPNIPQNTTPDHVIRSTSPMSDSAIDSHLINISDRLIEVKNKRYQLSFDPKGARLVYALILSETSSGEDNSFSLLDHRQDRTYLIQSGLVGDNSPNHETLFQLMGEPVQQGDKTTLSFKAQKDGVQVVRSYTINENNYLIEVEDQITNMTSKTIEPMAYYQILRKNVKDEKIKNDKGFASTFSGFASYDSENKYDAEKLDSIKKNPIDQISEDGWIAGVEHYFLTAWLPEGAGTRHITAKTISGSDIYTITSAQFLGQIAPHQTLSQKAKLWVGPQEQAELKKVDPTLNLSVDYGWMTFLAKPVFSLMNWIHTLVGNWGWTIIIITFLIKLILYPLVAKSQRSMAKMKLISPRMQLLKEQFGDDKAKLNAAMMELYKAEKINPMGGCLPILLTIPVFLTLYRVILYSVELRGAPWLAWITDLSVSDPFYILPGIMILTMFIQFKLNPTPPDKTQARMMMIMPLVFGFMMIWFPSGMVIYWTTNNILSIIQQWYINKKIEQENNEKILTHR